MADTYKGGLLRDDDGALVVVFASSAVAPLTVRHGYLVDANGALVIRGA